MGGRRAGFCGEPGAEVFRAEGAFLDAGRRGTWPLMSWEYWFLKRSLGIAQDSLLTLFEIFCERAYDAMGAMEWSWKFERRRCVANRVLWLGAPGRREATSRNLRWLA